MTRTHRLATTILLSSILSTSLAATVRAQQTLGLANGDRYSGRVTRIDGTTWVFRTDGGELKVPAARISAYTAPTPIGVRLADGAIAAVTVAPVDSELAVTFDDATTRRIAVADIEAIGSPTDLDALEKIQIDVFRPFLMFWGASGSVGFSDKSGNSQARGISVTLDVERKAPKDRIALTGGIARESQPNDVGDLVPAVAKQYAGVRFDFYFNPRFFTFAATLQERDKFQDLDLRSNYNAGLGVQAVASRVTDLRFSLASGVRAEYYTGNGHNTAAVLTSDLGYKQRLGFATLDWKGGWAPNIKDFGDYRLRSNATLTASIYAGLGFRVGLLNEFNSRPRPDVRKHDMLVTTTVAYTMGSLR